jgi:hypothetical protein
MSTQKRLIPFLILTVMTVILFAGMLLSVQGQISLPRAAGTPTLAVTLPFYDTVVTNQNVQFRWELIPDLNGADPGFGYKYKLSITDSLTGVVSKYSIDPADCAGSCIFNPLTVDSSWSVTDDRQYTWKVVAKLNGGAGKLTQSPKVNYVVSVWESISLGTPASNAILTTSANPHIMAFTWIDSGADFYRLLVRNTANQSVHYDSGTLPDFNICTGGNCLISAMLPNPPEVLLLQWQIIATSNNVTGKLKSPTRMFVLK